MPRVSVIIVTYNQVHSIGRAIESVLDQKGDTDFEIVIGDDGSTDGTREVCLDYAAKHHEKIRVMAEAPNKGVVRNYFDCLKVCRGEFITDCAGDDYWTDPLKIDRLTGLLDAHPDCTVAFSDWNILDSATGQMSRASEMEEVLPTDGRVCPTDELLVRVLNHRNSLPYNLTASMYRRKIVTDALKENGLMVCNPDFGCEDLPVMALLASKGGAVGCDTPTYTYVMNPESIIGGDDNGKLVRFYTRSLRCCRVLAGHYRIDPRRLRAMFRAKAAFIVGMALKSRDTALMRIAVEAVEEWPLRPRLITRIKMMVSKVFVTLRHEPQGF
ncbi:MAG: glycosyltransferase [Muribaculaceae bacterium]|nr:glycosyltransferase [Muribaculaceae bacterium]